MIDQIQDSELAKSDLREHERLKEMRAPWEQSWREIDERFPNGAGGFDKRTPGAIRGHRNFDSQHIISLGKFKAAMTGITTPEQEQYIRPYFIDDELNKEREVQLWRQRTGVRLQRIRHAMHTGFTVAVDEDWDQLGRYGTSAMWSEATPYGMMYRTIHLSQLYIDNGFNGLVNRVHRMLEKTARECEELFGIDALTPKMRKALEPGQNKENEKFEILHVVMPNRSWDRDSWDHNRYPVSSRYLAVDEKLYVRRKGYRTMPISVSRHKTSPEEIYGRSPAMDVLPNINTLQAMKKTTLRAGHKAVDPALIFHHDGGRGGKKIVRTKMGGLNPGFVNEDGRALIARMPGGENGIPYALELMEGEKEPIRVSFMEEFYKILTDPNSRMTTTEVLEVMSKQGILVRPYGSRYELEKMHPTTQRDMELAMEAGQIEDLPDVVREADAWPLMAYENELAAMARAQTTARTMRYVEYATSVTALANTPAANTIDLDKALRNGGEEIGVNPEILRDPEETREAQQGQAADLANAQDAEALERSAGALKDLAQAEALGAG